MTNEETKKGGGVIKFLTIYARYSKTETQINNI